MLLQNVIIENSQQTSDLRIQDGKFAEIAPKLQPLPQEETIDMGGKLMLPPFIESHVHLDTCLPAGEPDWNHSGTLFEGIECWGKRKEMLSREDVRRRVMQAVRMQAAYFLTKQTLLIMALGLVAFMFDTAGGVLGAKLITLFLPKGKKLNPMIGACGISAFPMSARVVYKMAIKEDPQNYLLMQCVGVNVSGQVASVIAGGLLLNLLV